MSRNPSHAPARPPQRLPQQQPRHGASLKRDINLLPANQSSEKIAQRGTIALFVLLGAALLAWLIILMPLNNLKQIQDKAAAEESELEAKKQVETEFTDLAARRDALRQMQDDLRMAEQAYLPSADLVAMISTACPDTITLFSMKQDPQSVTITGRAQTDSDVAQFIVNMKSLPSIYGAGVKSVQPESAGTASPKRLFEVTARLVPEPTPSPSPTPAPSPTQKGGDGK